MILVAFLMSFAHATEHKTIVCNEAFLSAPAPYREYIRNHTTTDLPTEHTVAYVGVTSEELMQLAQTGTVTFTSEKQLRMVDPYEGHPVVRQAMEDLGIESSYQSKFPVPTQSEGDAWTATVRPILRARAAAQNLTLPEGDLKIFARELYGLRGRSEPYSFTRKDLLTAAHQLWSVEASTPHLSLNKFIPLPNPLPFFADLPRDAGFVLALRPEAFPNLIFDKRDVTRIYSLNLEDVGAVRPLRADELKFLTEQR